MTGTRRRCVFMMTTNRECDVTSISPGIANTAGPITAMPTLAVIIVTDTEGEKELLILLTRTYYLNTKDIIYKHKQLYNYMEIHVVITLF